MLYLLNKGGWVMYVILFCSITAITIIIERIIYFKLTKYSYPDFIKNLKDNLSKNASETNSFIQNNKTLLGIIARTYISNIQHAKSILDEFLFNKGSQQIKILEKRLSLLQTIGRMTPLMGLLGTVLGMIICFHDIQAIRGQADVTTLAGGIWEALLTTAFGLAVAIPIIISHHIFESIVDNRSDDINYLISELDIFFNKVDDPNIQAHHAEMPG